MYPGTVTCFALYATQLNQTADLTWAMHRCCHVSGADKLTKLHGTNLTSACSRTWQQAAPRRVPLHSRRATPLWIPHLLVNSKDLLASG